MFVATLFSSNIIFHAVCPPIIKKFESLAALYQQQLEIKKIQTEIYPKEEFDASLNHVADFYIKNLNENAFARWASLLLFILSWITLAYFVYKFRAFLINCT